MEKNKIKIVSKALKPPPKINILPVKQKHFGLKITAPNHVTLPYQIVDFLENQYSQFSAQKNQNDNFQNIQAYYYEQDDLAYYQIWNVKFIGRKDSIYNGKILTGRLYFPDNFQEFKPQNGPKFYFDHINNKKNKQLFYHLNVYADGELCHRHLNTYHILRARPHQILLQIQKVIYHPNGNDPANMSLNDYSRECPKGYLKLLKEQAEKLQNAQ